MSNRPVQRTQRRRSGTCPAASAITRWVRVSYDAAVLDLGLPDGDGLAVLAAALRRIAGLNTGADDYLTKPFAMTELIARIKVLLRRPGGVLGTTLEAGNVILDTVGREVAIAGVPSM
jgi:DNA-binding response OmpR family regulator